MKAQIIDLSHHNRNIQFGELKQAGVEAVILKATQGTYRFDPQFADFADRARSKGLLVGAYHFVTGEDATTQLDHFLKAVEPFRKLVLCLDYEKNPNAGGQPTPAILASMVKEMVQRLWRHPVLYGGDRAELGTLLSREDADPVFKNCRKWIARYNAKPPATECDIWQYTDKLKIAGYGPFDGNAFVSKEFKTVSDFWKRFEI